MIAVLYEDWLQAKGNWFEFFHLPECEANPRPTQAWNISHEKTRPWLIEKYGEATALQIIQSKKDLQAKRGPNDPVWVMANPDVPDSEVSHLLNL